MQGFQTPTRPLPLLLLLSSLWVLGGLLAVNAGPSSTGLTASFKAQLLKEIKRVDATRPASCTWRYPLTSTMCAYQDSPHVVQSGVSVHAQATIVALHNKFRSAVLPTATNMAKMYWDEELAKFAQKWAMTCPRSGHDTNENRKLPGYGLDVGQNVGLGYTSWVSAIGDWQSEVSLYRPGASPADTARVGHYTQIVRDLAVRVGCGYAKCTTGTYHVCNYIHGNAYNSAPYRPGVTCAACRKTCVNHLCDCRGLLCKNGGVLDQNSCTCSCVGAWHGADCGTCPTRDMAVCSTYTRAYCSSRTVAPQCPNLCGTCPRMHAAGTGNYPSGGVCTPTTQDRAYCSMYPRAYCTQQPGWARRCPRMCGQCQPITPVTVTPVTTCSPSTRDESFCSRFPKTYCGLYLSWAQHCPITCNKCKSSCVGLGCMLPACSGKTCLNGGDLRTDCVCKCPPKWKGSTCQFLARCPDRDVNSYCGTLFLKKDCTMISALKMRGYRPSHCPNLCGLCMPKCVGMSNDYCGQHGQLDKNCVCACDNGFSGLKCTLPFCRSDSSYCWYYAKHCNIASVRKSCNKMCKVC